MSHERFDTQAATFDERVGLSLEVARAVADAIVEISGAGPEDLVLEIGAGTGEIGVHLLALSRYVGIDRSDAMLDVFRGRLDEASVRRASLLRHDADGVWPVEDGSVTAVFGSRVVHLLEPRHLEGELRRVLRPAGVLLAGRVIHDPDGVRSRLRRIRRHVLREHGVQAGQSDRRTEHLFGDLIAQGWIAIDPCIVARWPVTATANQILGEWAGLTGMGDGAGDPALRGRALDEVRLRAENELGDLSSPETSTESYRVTGVRIGGTPTPASV